MSDDEWPVFEERLVAAPSEEPFPELWRDIVGGPQFPEEVPDDLWRECALVFLEVSGGPRLEPCLVHLPEDSETDSECRVHHIDPSSECVCGPGEGFGDLCLAEDFASIDGPVVEGAVQDQCL